MVGLIRLTYLGPMIEECMLGPLDIDLLPRPSTQVAVRHPVHAIVQCDLVRYKMSRSRMTRSNSFASNDYRYIITQVKYATDYTTITNGLSRSPQNRRWIKEYNVVLGRESC